MTEEQTKENILRLISLDNTSRKPISPCYYSAADVFDWLQHEGSDLHYKWLQKVATDQETPKEEKSAMLINVIDHASECLSDIAPSRSKQKKVAKEISTLINTIIE